MTVSRGAPYWLCVGGKWVHLGDVTKGVQVSNDRPTSYFRSLGNKVYTRVAPVAKRVWGFFFEWENAEASRWLDFAAANPSAEVWLLDRNLAQINMLDPRTTKGTSATLIDVDGISMRAFAANESFTAKVRPGATYHLSYTTTAAAEAVLGTISLGGAPVNFLAPEGVGSRRGSVAVTADALGTLVVVWASGLKATAARLTEGSVDVLGFMESRGMTPCRVLVGDGAATYRMAWESRLALADATYVVTEVG